MTKTFNPNHPVVLGLCGEALTGKTVTANGIAPAISTNIDKDGALTEDPSWLSWDHLFFALPLYRMATARGKIEGESAEDRIRYEIHNSLLEIFGANPLFGAPPYSDLISMVNEITSLPFPTDGSKPRTFLQKTGTDICRAYDNDCFVKWMTRKVKTNHSDFLYQRDLEFDTDEDLFGRPLPQFYSVVISDLRFMNEAQYVHENPNGVIVRLTASPEVRAERSMKRDGMVMTTEQQQHASELDVRLFPAEWCVDLETDDLTVDEQVTAALDILYSQLEGLP